MQRCNDESKQNLVRWRRYLHQHPETVSQEFETDKLIINNPKSWDQVVTEGTGEIGVVTSLIVGDSNACTDIRAGMDAINLQE